jgi:serine/threonine-protein kinase RsbW
MQKASSESTQRSGFSTVCLEVPGKIECREVVLRTVSAACRLIPRGTQKEPVRGCDFRTNVVSAVGEAYNNIVLHGYAGREPGAVQMKIENCPECLRVVLSDTGASFDPSQAPPPDLAALPESGLGIFVMRSMVDELSYVAGTPNVLTLVKHLDGQGRASANDPQPPAVMAG